MDTMHLLPSVAIGPNLELKTRAKQLLGYLPVSYRAPQLIPSKTLIFDNYVRRVHS